jgi:predicted amidohydrolase
MRLILVQPQLRADPAADNLEIVLAAIRAARVEVDDADILLLPEAVARRSEPYEHDIVALATSLGCHVVGGSHRSSRNGGVVNAGIAVDGSGTLIGRYEKLRPYAEERADVEPGAALGEITIAGRNVLVLICADFWFADLFQRATSLPDLILVPALSVTRKSTPDYSRALWRHLAVARAYEFGVYVGISDWGYPSQLPARFACGVGGFADPTAVDPQRFFTPVGAADVGVYHLDFAALQEFRHDRMQRGFFWKRADGSSIGRPRLGSKGSP